MKLRLLLYGLQVASCAWSVRDLLHRFDHYSGAPGSALRVLVTLRCLLTAAAVFAALALARRGFSSEPRVRDLRTFMYCPLAALLLASLAHAWIGEEPAIWASRSVFFSGLMGAQALWVGLRLRAAPREWHAASRWPRRLDLVAMNILLCLVITEVVTVAWARFRPSPLLFSRSVDQRLEAMRQPAGAVHFDSRLNSGGYLDDEVFAARPGDLVVAVLADSFGLGVVPRSHNFVSVAESRLREALGHRYRRVALHNFGVPGIGLPEYARILATEALPMRPEIVVVCLFVGNDIHDGTLFGETDGEHYVLQEWLVWTAVEREWKLWWSTPEERSAVASIGHPEEPLGEIPPFVENADLEPPTFSEERFFAIESSRLEVANPYNGFTEKAYKNLFRGLRHFQDVLGKRLLVVLLPDEFQVNDALFERILADREDPDRYGRDWPQHRILAFCRRSEMTCVDLLPLLREAERDGRTYHLRDTHLNAFGNRVVGEELASAILHQLELPGTHTRGGIARRP